MSEAIQGINDFTAEEENLMPTVTAGQSLVPPIKQQKHLFVGDISPRKTKDSPPKPIDLAEKLLSLEYFVTFEGELYRYDSRIGYFILSSRDDTKSIILDRLREDLRLRGSANQLQDIYTFLLHDARIQIEDLPPAGLFRFTNGTLDINTGNFLPGPRPDLFFRWRFETCWDPSAGDYRNFSMLLHRIAGGDQLLIARLWEVLGYLLISPKNRKFIVLFQGEHDSGKSLLGAVISAFFDQRFISNLGAGQFENRFASHNLLGKVLNVSMDLPGGRLGATAVAVLKQITGGDRIFVEAKGVDGHSVHLECKFVFGTNHPFAPAVRDDAFMERIVLIPFRYSVPREEQDQDLLGKIVLELPAIFNQALQAYYQLEANHFQFTGEDQFGIRAAGMKRSCDNFGLGDFIEHCCEFQEGAFTPIEDLHSAYLRYCEVHGHIAIENPQVFSQKFNAETGDEFEHWKKRINGTSKNGYKGVRLI